jgi:serine O-acetyltransferase
MKLADIDVLALSTYVARQLDYFFPDDDKEHLPLLSGAIKAALERTVGCLDAVKTWRGTRFDVLHTSHYTTFLYCLANQIWVTAGHRRACNKLFALNKALNGIDLFYEITMPSKFLIGHSTGIVLAKATYGEYLMICQNSTIGRYKDRYPTIGAGTILYPNCAIIGACVVGANTVLAQGASLIDTDSPGNCIVERAPKNANMFKPVQRRQADDYFFVT